jgi:hypothetical protein
MTPDDSMDLVEIVARAIYHAADEQDYVSDYKFHGGIDTCFDGNFDLSQIAARILTAIESSGRRIVPVEMTDLMAVSAVDDFDQMGVDVDRAMVRSAWSAALSASPKVTT